MPNIQFLINSWGKSIARLKFDLVIYLKFTYMEGVIDR